MSESWDYPRALHELWRRSSYERGLISDPFGNPARAEQGLARMRALLVELDNPQTRVPTVHIAGSKGKGSTAAFVASAARADAHGSWQGTAFGRGGCETRPGRDGAAPNPGARRARCG